MLQVILSRKKVDLDLDLDLDLTWIIPTTDQDCNPIQWTKETDKILIAKCTITCPVNTNKSINHQF
jgi:hypothetical protein